MKKHRCDKTSCNISPRLQGHNQESMKISLNVFSCILNAYDCRDSWNLPLEEHTYAQDRQHSRTNSISNLKKVEYIYII